jgi:predicted nucleic acid-binding protein
LPNSFLADASVIAKWFNKGEDYEEDALALRAAWIDESVELFSPSLVLYEVCNSIWKNPNIDEDQATSIARLVMRIKPNLIEVGEEELAEAMSIAKKSKLTFYDSIYIALSKSRKCPLISADNDQLEAAKNHAISIHISKIKRLLRS